MNPFDGLIQHLIGLSGQPALYVLPGATSGLVTPGNLDLRRRPVVRNPNGSVSTVRTISIGTDAGEVLLPTVVDGRVISPPAAIAHFKKTGQHLGVFANAAAADAYAQRLHLQQAQAYGIGG